MSDAPAAPLTVAAWRRTADIEEDSTPKCPRCGRRLGIRLGIWRDDMNDAWLCDKCGEFEAI